MHITLYILYMCMFCMLLNMWGWLLESRVSMLPLGVQAFHLQVRTSRFPDSIAKLLALLKACEEIEVWTSDLHFSTVLNWRQLGRAAWWHIFFWVFWDSATNDLRVWNFERLLKWPNVERFRGLDLGCLFVGSDRSSPRFGLRWMSCRLLLGRTPGWSWV